MSEKPKCYNCKHRGEIPGDAHSMCCHPETGLRKGHNPFMAFGDMKPGARKALGVQGHETGVRRGWFAWPVNFDPVWLVSCDGYEQ